ncbi:MAG: carboxymuconolactone decarboxylase family protein [Gammaproteobacteria bacterium]|nr:carboxymuconolactone decarboxylase family protein [Gammaproteobacteria bacterium]
MSRLQKIEPEDWAPELKAAIQPENLTALEQGLTRFFAHCPDLMMGMMGFAGAMKTKRTLSDKLVELVRLRIAFFNQCRSCMAIRYTDALNDGVTEDLVCSLEKPAEADNLTAAEKAAIRFGELMASDHLAIDDGVYDELREHFSEAQIVELGMWSAFCVGFGRLAATWHMVEELPEAFKDTTRTLSPWNEESIQVR